MTNEQISQKCNEAQQKWEEFIKQSKEEKENKLMDFYPRNINNDTEQNQKLRKKAINTIKKEKFRQHTFTLLTKQVGKGEKQSLKRVKVINQQNEVIKECNDRESIEYEIANYNK